MRLAYTPAVIAALCTKVALGDFITPTYPTPVDLSSNHSLARASWQNLTSSLDQYLQGKLNASAAAAFAGVEDVTFSVGMFSLNDPQSLQLQYHHAAAEVKNATAGTRSVDENSIYRVASVSKLITTFAGLLRLSAEDWHRPLSEINPNFKPQKNSSAVDVIQTTQWDKITPWALATQLSGLPTLGFLGDYYNQSLASEFGGPIVNVSSLGACVANLYNHLALTCSTAEIISSLKDLPPNFLPWKTPVYSDLNFMLLGLAISDLTNTSIADVYSSAIFAPLNMTSSSARSQNKTLSREVVVGTLESYLLLDSLPFTAPSGGVLSTLGDLRKLGLGILNSTLLDRNATDRWMKPVSHTASLSYSIGAPWEIHRFVHPSGRVTDIYTKLGDSGLYGAALVLIPQYDAGFAFLNGASADGRSETALGILDAVTTTVLPALEAEAAAEAKRNFVGTYSSSTEGLNVSLTVGFNASLDSTDVHSGLVVTEWMYNGTDILKSIFFRGFTPRLEQSVVRRGADSKPRQVAFIASTYDQTPTYAAAKLGPWTGFYHSDGDFIYTDHFRYGGQPVRELVFDLDETGAAVKCTPSYQRIALTKSRQ
ncbi:Beta-lactamase/transpeptidase-like protein [Cordyceps fumosorosea ARSEF 2679]|uniref:Beta-lactamase/transpeptidase-like protein n=1 Tax=Cordyceps fumosorosea (strain ARSEF 2679) TaxID=1081104 RepID=A0A167SYG2_CORFA|nr:Beta-lactamase/transpeptidase-like protein [Cordyceps fumosorosea ARSEF 2679]OAA60062.1 Beta-lactamase/transpeptidase-like protein [Cordyceps fumosorosea ARSEF 2679]